MEWVTRKTPASQEDLPNVSGFYAVMISGDCETDGPHVYYDYPDYQTFANFCVREENDEPEYAGVFTGIRDEETEMVFAWYGPIELPAYVTPAS